MNGRGFPRNTGTDAAEIKGFDAFDLRLGDIMRGERATLGKSLLDVQRELRIKAAYIAAIENCDPSAFDAPGFIAGYVRSYARYLGMDPDTTFTTFCAESGFTTAHGMSSAASSLRHSSGDRPARGGAGSDIFAAPRTPFIPPGDAVFSGIQPGAVGSILVLIALIGGLGYGGWTVLQEVQRVQIAPVEQAPSVISRVDPLAGQGPVAEGGAIDLDQNVAAFIPPTTEALGRLYRPDPLDVPVMVPRDGPISTLDPRRFGTFAAATAQQVGRDTGAGTAQATDAVLAAVQEALLTPEPVAAAIQVTADPVPEVVLFAVRPSWIRVRAADGTVIFEKILDSGEEFALPVTEEPPVLRAGNAGSLYFKVNGEAYGPAGPGASIAKNVALSVDGLRGAYQVADLSQDQALADYMTAEVSVEVTVAD